MALVIDTLTGFNYGKGSFLFGLLNLFCQEWREFYSY